MPNKKAPKAIKTPFWLRVLPTSLRIRIEHRFGLRRALINTGWLFGDRVLRMGAGLLVGVWMARYLGPGQFGMLNYALAFVSMFSAIATLGLNAIVVRDLVKEPQNANATLGTAFMLQLIGGFLAFFAATLFVGFVRPDDALVKLMVIVLGSAMVFKSSEVVKYWFEAEVQSKYTVWIENACFLLFALVKIILILGQASLMAFVWTIFAEAVVVFSGLLAVYAKRVGTLAAWKVRSKLARKLLIDSWPLILSGFAVMVYMRIDQIMIGQMMGDDAVGIYSAAVRISEVWYFIPVAIVASVFPAVIEAKNQNEAVYYQWLQRLYDLMVLLALLVAVPVMFLSEWIVLMLFGDAYQQASPVLAIHIWAGVFVFLGLASSKWLVLENFQREILYRSLLGMVANVILNIFLIPLWGVKGAALATIISYALSVFSIYLNSNTRIGAVMMVRSLKSFGLNRHLGEI